MPHQALLTREAFLALVPPDAVCLAEPVDVVRCECRDVNCHGWKFIARDDRVAAPAAGEFRYVRELESA
jgi:hypothetical protein